MNQIKYVSIWKLIIKLHIMTSTLIWMSSIRLKAQYFTKNFPITFEFNPGLLSLCLANVDIQTKVKVMICILIIDYQMETYLVHCCLMAVCENYHWTKSSLTVTLTLKIMSKPLYGRFIISSALTLRNFNWGHFGQNCIPMKELVFSK